MALTLVVQPTIICEQPVSVEYRDGLFYVTDPAISVVRAMRPKTYFQNIANFVECSRKHQPWKRESAEIIDLHAAKSELGSASK